VNFLNNHFKKKFDFESSTKFMKILGLVIKIFLHSLKIFLIFLSKYKVEKWSVNGHRFGVQVLS
jgi:hypothetical protein